MKIRDLVIMWLSGFIAGELMINNVAVMPIVLIGCSVVYVLVRLRSEQ